MGAIQSYEEFISFQSQQIYLKHFFADKSSSQLDTIDKSPIILLHESLGSVALWKQFPQTLANATGREVIAYDRIGFGLSSDCNEQLEHDFVWAEAQGAFKAIVDACELKQFIVLGHSVGGGMALSIAAAYPSQCLAVISISAQAKVEQLTLDGISAAKENFKAPELFQRLAKYHGEKTQWVLDAWTETWLAPAFATWHLSHVLNQIYCPVQVIHGDIDQYATQSQPEQIASQVKGEVQLCILEECGHFPHQEKTAEVVQFVQHFVSVLS
ncbi:alpha/beta fold hydrolase [Acinetobacter rudis]|uniref:Alpha/beta hydrolase n=1 Tax=Acinetobacter rudis TaxID=632955 RepID=A0AAW8J6P8_9GAMM|nr:alpha/beta hydrolase [Acinetobacter rudis]MDQ8935113.1 alpha/beta hydrolase [Acinetobacter rudis]MDQ8952976.1 alpha/beta hydrolase [Acinetobacter rudis]MDQ9016981.1 alpha/beta hydrolase [Acinetobacter rudis]